MRRRTLLGSLAATAAAAPAIVRAAGASTLRFIPQIDLAVLDPHVTPAYVTRNHGYLVFDTLYGQDSRFQASPQMVEGHVVEADGRDWRLRLRDGLAWHDGAPVLARDCVASIRRWAKRDAFGDALMQATDELSASDDRTVRFRLKRPFPLLPDALGKAASYMPAMMPERLADTDPFKPVTEMVGSGPFRFKPDERVPGARTVYERSATYRPRETGTTDWTAGPKIARFDRVEWTTIPDPATAAAALQAGEQDWWEYAAHDLLPLLRRNPAVRVTVLDPTGMVCMLRPNHLQPPFDNPAIRRALLGAFDQAEFMQAIFGEDRDAYRTPLGVFCPGTPMASEAGLSALTGPRDPARAAAEIRRAGYKGERVVLLVPGDYVTARALGEVAARTMRSVGMTVDLTLVDQGTLLQRRTRKEPVDQGGWSMFVTSWAGSDWLNPAGHVAMRGTGAAGYPGWSSDPRIEALRDAWLTAPDLAAQQAICRDIQAACMAEVPFYPLGQYVQATAYRSRLSGVLNGFATFWNVGPA